jgi:hypothetical protein
MGKIRRTRKFTTDGHKINRKPKVRPFPKEKPKVKVKVIKGSPRTGLIKTVKTKKK